MAEYSLTESPRHYTNSQTIETFFTFIHPLYLTVWPNHSIRPHCLAILWALLIYSATHKIYITEKQSATIDRIDLKRKITSELDTGRHS